MGCAGIEVRESGLKDIDGQNLQNMDLDLKNILILYLFPKLPKNIKIGIYVDTIYHKKKGLNKIIKYSKSKFFLKNNSNKSFNPEVILKQFLEKFPQFIKNDDISNNNVFSPKNILDNNYTNLFKSLDIETTNKINLAICFINEKENDSNLVLKLNAIKEKFEKNFYIYKIQNSSDKYGQYEQYTLFFRENKVNFWVENDYYNSNCFNSLLNHNKMQTKISKSSNDINLVMNSDSIKNFLNTYLKPEDEYIINNKYYKFYDKDGNVVSFNEFPTFIITPIPQQHFNEQIIMISSKKKLDINNFIINEIKKYNQNINIQKIEIFKERITSLLIQNYFVFKKKYSLFLSSIDKDILFNLIKQINENINPTLKNININYSVENIIILPKTNSKFNFYDENKLVYIIIYYSTCIKFVQKHLKEKYGEIYNTDIIKILCIYRENDDIDISLLNNNNDIIYLNEKLLLRDNKYIDFYIYSFNPINYFSHILIIVNLDGIIQYANYFKNRASIFYNHLKDELLAIKQNLPLIEINDFKNVKNYFNKKIKFILDNAKSDKNENIIEYDDENIFDNYYKNNILYQPYLSLKYNKIINPNKKDEKKYKNYSLNYINFKDIMEMPFDEDNHKPLNEISHIYYEKDNYIFNKKDLRCKDCFSKLNNNNKFRFYLCPISKDAICEDCYKKNDTFENNYPFNLLFINCKNKDIFENLPKYNILLFRDKIKYKNHPEILNEICDLCGEPLCNNDNTGIYFFIIINIIRKNNFLICNNCFELLNDEKRSWYFNNKYNYIKEFILNYFIDLNNLIFKKVKFI